MRKVNENVTGMQGILWGVAGGAVLALVLGFGMGVLTTESTANKQVANAIEETQASVYTATCVERFKTADAAVQKAIREGDSWRRDDLVEKAGLATPAGFDKPLSSIGESCSEALNAAFRAEEDAARASKEKQAAKS